MQIIFQLLAADPVPPTPDSQGHDLTWPYWVAFAAVAVLVVVLPMIWGRSRAGGAKDKKEPRPN